MNKNTSRTAAFFKSKGLYLVLAGCVLAAGLASWNAINNMRGSLENQQQSISGGGQGEWDVPVVQDQSGEKITEGSSAPPNGDASSSPSGEPVAELNEQDEMADLQGPYFILPLAGEVVTQFSGNELVYHETLADWRTHNGTDIGAAADAAVTAAAAGTITKVYNDVLWGTVIEQTSGGLTLRYAGLHKDVVVKAGDEVTLGQTLGRVGELPAEAAQGPHIHFEVIDTNGYKNPLSLVG
ncbi:M23 family metallopeptidase [Ruminococcaceae bacterium OttesenSCG-928-N02]|nr:M23 family metallopeptidase [Ruminococcaceae bacterium OttesenSCG-928-N02]